MSRMSDLDIERMNNELDPEPTDEELEEISQEEEQTLENWDDIICCACYRPIKLSKAVFINDYPYHKWCAEEL